MQSSLPRLSSLDCESLDERRKARFTRERAVATRRSGARFLVPECTGSGVKYHRVAPGGKPPGGIAPLVGPGKLIAVHVDAKTPPALAPRPVAAGRLPAAPAGKTENHRAAGERPVGERFVRGRPVRVRLHGRIAGLPGSPGAGVRLLAAAFARRRARLARPDVRTIRWCLLRFTFAAFFVLRDRLLDRLVVVQEAMSRVHHEILHHVGLGKRA